MVNKGPMWSNGKRIGSWRSNSSPPAVMEVDWMKLTPLLSFLSQFNQLHKVFLGKNQRRKCYGSCAKQKGRDKLPNKQISNEFIDGGLSMSSSLQKKPSLLIELLPSLSFQDLRYVGFILLLLFLLSERWDKY